MRTWFHHEQWGKLKNNKLQKGEKNLKKKKKGKKVDAKPTWGYEHTFQFSGIGLPFEMGNGSIS